MTRKASVGWARSADDLRSALLGLASKDAQVEILLAGVKAACEPIKITAKRLAKRSERTGALRDSITIKAVGYKASGTAVGLVGPDRAYRVKGKKVSKLATLFAAAKGSLRRPANYAHLVEFGHRVARGGSLRGKYRLSLVGTGKFTQKGREIKRWKKGALIQAPTGTVTGFVPAKPFLRPAVITTRAQQAAAFEQAVADGLDRLLRKYNRQAGLSVKYRRAA